MFSGLVERIGMIEEITANGEARRVLVSVPDEEYLSDAKIGESIAVNGCCLTAIELGARHFMAEAIEETMRRTTLGLKTVGSKVNLERALRADARLGGHIVQGHVDGVATCVLNREEGEGWWVSFEPPSDLMKYVVEKGSICVDGISLTVANVAYSRFSVAIIPHTREVTTASDWQAGAQVNIETDILAKHVERLLQWTAVSGQQSAVGSQPNTQNVSTAKS